MDTWLSRAIEQEAPTSKSMIKWWEHVTPFTPHGLRHTFATKAIARGMRPKTLQKILGHNSLKMTMDLYCHVEQDTLREEMALIGEVVNNT